MLQQAKQLRAPQFGFRSHYENPQHHRRQSEPVTVIPVSQPAWTPRVDYSHLSVQDMMAAGWNVVLGDTDNDHMMHLLFTTPCSGVEERIEPAICTSPSITAWYRKPRQAKPMEAASVPKSTKYHGKSSVSRASRKTHVENPNPRHTSAKAARAGQVGKRAAGQEKNGKK